MHSHFDDGRSTLNGNFNDGRPTHIRFFVLGWLCLAAAIAYLQRNFIGAAESTIRAEIGLTKEQMGWMMSGFFWSYALSQIPAGWLGDRWGARTALARYAHLWSAATVTMVLAGTAVTASLAVFGGSEGVAVLIAWQWLVISRVLGGAGQAGLFPCAAIVVSRWFPATRRAVASGWLTASQQVGAVSAILLTGLLLSDAVGLTWRWIAVLYSLPGFAWAFFFFRWFRDRPQDHAEVNAGELQLIAQPPADQRSGGLADSKRLDAPRSTPWLALICSPPMWAICGQQFCRGFGYMFYATWFPTFLQESRGVSIPESGLLTALPVLTGLLGAMLGGAVSDFVLNTTGSRRLARQGVAITGLLGCAAFVFLAYFIEDPRQAVLIISAGSFCAALAGPAGYTVTMEMGGAHVATVCATMNMVGNLGAAMFPVLVPWLLLWRTHGGPPTENWDAVLFVFGGVYLLAAGFWLLLNPHGTVFDQSLWRRGASRQAE